MQEQLAVEVNSPQPLKLEQQSSSIDFDIDMYLKPQSYSSQDLPSHHHLLTDDVVKCTFCSRNNLNCYKRQCEDKMMIEIKESVSFETESTSAQQSDNTQELMKCFSSKTEESSMCKTNSETNPTAPVSPVKENVKKVKSGYKRPPRRSEDQK